MHGVPEDLDLRHFLGSYLTQVCIGKYQLQFNFSAGENLSVEGGWQLKDVAGVVLDQGIRDDSSERAFYRVHVLLGATVVGSEVDLPRSFTLFFNNGMTLTVLDDSQQYESFSTGGVLI
jgi:hypothetical protein